MNSEQILLVRKSFSRVAMNGEQFASKFYEKLFELDTSLRHLFKGDMKTQGSMLASMLTSIVFSLDDVDKLLPLLSSLGKRHAAYGVENQHYETVGAALLATLELFLADKFTPEVRDAWAEAYNQIAVAMQAGARGQAENGVTAHAAQSTNDHVQVDR